VGKQQQPNFKKRKQDNDNVDDDFDNHSDDSEIEIEQPHNSNTNTTTTTSTTIPNNNQHSILNRDDIRTFTLEKGYIKSNITKLEVQLENPIYSDVILGDFIPDSVTHLEIPILYAFLCPLIPKSVKSLKLKSQIPVYDGAFRMIPPHITDLSVIIVGDWTLPLPDISPTVKKITINKLYPFANLTSISYMENAFDIALHYNMDEDLSIVSSMRSNTINPVIQQLMKKDNVFVKCEGSGPIPQTTKHLTRMCRDTDPLPFGITQLICCQDRAIPPGELPESLTKITFINLNQCLSNVHLPQSLKYLLIPAMDQLIYRNTHIPKSVTHLGVDLHSSVHEGIVRNSWLYKKGYLPESVRFIIINIANLKPSQISDIILPSSILYFDLQVEEVYIDRLELFYKKIKFIDAQEYYHNAPEFVQTSTLETGNISKIDFGKHFNQLIKPGQLSSNITDLTFGQSYLQSIDEGVIPSSVDKLTLECKESIGAVSIPYPISSLSIPAIFLPDNPLADKTSIKDLSIDGKLNQVERMVNLDDEDDQSLDELDQTPSIPILIEQLPFLSLEKLCLKNVKNIGSETMTEYSFPHLQELKIDTIYPDTQRIYVDFLSKVMVNLKSLFLYGNFKSHLKNIDFPSTKLESLDANEFFHINPNQIPSSMKNLSIPINEKNFNLIQSKNFVQPKIKNDNQDFLKKRFEINSRDNELFFQIWRNSYLKPMVFSQLQDMMAHSFIYHDYHSKKEDIERDGSRFKNLSIFTDTVITGLDKIPSNVIAWYFSNRAQTLPSIIPETVKKTACGYYPNIQIPSWITHFSLYYGDGKIVKKGFLPESITHLELDTITIASQYEEFGFFDDDNEDQDDESSDYHNDFENDDIRESQRVGVLFDEANSDDEDHDDGDEQRKERDRLDDEDEAQNDEIEAYYLTLKEALPSKLRVLNIFNLKFGVCNIIPPTVEILQIRDPKFKLVDKSFKNLPSTIKKIKIPKNCFQNVKKIPSFLSTRLDGNYQVYEKNATIGKKTSHLIINGPLVIKKGLIPDNVNTIIFGHSFNQPIPHLPSSITEIKFGYHFNQDLSTISFPPNLKYLSFGDSFDKPLDSLPAGLKFLQFQVLNPHSAQSLASIPDSVDHLSIKHAFLDSDSDDEDDNDDYSPPSNPLLVIPDCIKFLKLGVYIENVKLPLNLKSITCHHSCLGENKLKTSEKKVRETIDTTLSLENIDPSIKLNINTTGSFDRLINPNSLIDNIKSISFGTNFNQVLPKNSLPPSVEFLKFGFCYDQQFQIGNISSSVTQLELGTEYDKSLKGILPNGLKKLIIKSGFYHKDMLDWLPKSLEYLELGNDEIVPSPQPFPIEKLPTNITTLILNDSVIISSPSKIPKTIKHLKLCKCKTWDYLPIDSLESLTLGEYNYPLNMIFKSK
ncbi:hypothetical protein CYY_000954, partial [Polysphondylium violaceum]